MSTELTRRFTPFTLLILSINGMVGSAWLFAPFYAAKIAGSAAIISWLIGGMGTAMIALTFAELSVLFPVAGGTAQIPLFSHGAFCSFIMGWIAWLSALTMAPIEVQAVLQYASNYFTSLITLKGDVPVLSGFGYLWATLLMLLFCGINMAGYRGLMRSNLLVFVFKISVMFLAVLMLIQTHFKPGNFSGFWAATSTLTGWQAILTAVATGGVAFAFTGFKHGVELAGETRRIALTLPLAIVGSIVFCLLLYIGLQIAFIGALGDHDLAGGWKNLSFVGDIGPFAGLAAGLGILWLAKLLYADAVVSPSGAALIYVTSTARILYAMSQMGYMPRWMSVLNAQRFPVGAIVANFVLGMFIFLPLPGWQAMVSFLVSGMVLSYAMGPIALLCMRLEFPRAERGFRLPAAGVISLMAFYFCNLLSYWTGWDTIYKLFIAILAGFIFFTVAVLRRRIKLTASVIKSTLWLIPYFIGLAFISWLGAFGGKNLIPFGWDFLVIGIFSVIILGLAVKTRIVHAEGETPQRFVAESASDSKLNLREA